MRLADRQATEGTFAPGPREERPRPVAVRRPLAARLAILHGTFLIACGAFRLRRAVGAGAALANVGAALFYAGARGDARRPLRLLAATTALTNAALDFAEAQPMTALAQLGFAAAWIGAEIRQILRSRRRPEAAFA